MVTLAIAARFGGESAVDRHESGRSTVQLSGRARSESGKADFIDNNRAAGDGA
ncbi:hypothetical protein [Rathayibacter festucae]|uniref:hypothetical protein n=1 Tax=Rathayibacter festucae TaxID=110937 RepID=UPI0013E2B689|nr:hypothetical protein [Rathayibacter festucae]